MPLVLRQGRDDTGHPLLVASHRLHVPIVRFLLSQALSTRQRGTVHPYTGDNMTVADLKGVSLDVLGRATSGNFYSLFARARRPE